MATNQEKGHRFRNWKNTKFSTMAWVLAILILIIAIVINMIFSRFDFSWDLSSNQQFSLSDTTEEYLDELDAEGITVDFYLLTEMEELEADTDVLVLYRTLLAYESHDCINLIDFDPNTEEEIIDEFDPDGEYSLSTGDMVICYGDNTRRVPGTSMYVTYYDDDGEETDEEFYGENLITGSIKGVVEGFTPTVYFLTGHGEKSIDEYEIFCTNLMNYNYQAEELNLSEVTEVPDDTALILVCAPTSDLEDEEKEVLDAYLDEGGNITLLMSPNNGAFAYTNFEAVMEDYGIYMDYDLVYETESDYHAEDDDTTIMCELTELSEDSEADDLTSSLIDQGLYTYMPASRSFTIDDEGGIYTVESLITSYSTAIGESYGGVSDDPEDIEDISMILAAYSTSNHRNSSKMVVFGNAEFLDDDNVTSEYFIIPLYVMLSTVSWMYDSDIDMEIEETSTVYDYIDLQSDAFATGLIVVLAVIPIAIMTVGVVIWVTRRNS